ncbi:DUF1310 family protein [uncultured Abiotrophia sp.]|uniref:DUF1310 family protein n=1 Tax=uncultured Abiotrophia sp. TaxID=316094 RepID=UPI0028D75668|nr:DUF1310 family protein [uncultured Abiotrophia sp.]
MFKKTRVMVTISLLILLAIICFPLYQYHQTQQEVKAEINRTLHSPAVHAKIEGFLLKEDKQALTSMGKIQSYEIDYSSARPNPMGGIIFNVYINGDRDINVNFNLSKHTNREDSSQSSENRFSYSVAISEKFQQLVGE